MYNKGLALEKMEKFEEAISSFKKSLEIDSQYSDSLTSMGLCVSKLGRDEEAIKIIDQALLNNEKNSAALYGKSLILGRLGKSSESVLFLQKAIDEDINRINKSKISDKFFEENKNPRKVIYDHSRPTHFSQIWKFFLIAADKTAREWCSIK